MKQILVGIFVLSLVIFTSCIEVDKFHQLSNDDDESLNSNKVVPAIFKLFHLEQVTDLISTVEISVIQQLASILTKLLFAGNSYITQAKHIIAHLIADLNEHRSEDVPTSIDPLVSQAIVQLTQLVDDGGKIKKDLSMNFNRFQTVLNNVSKVVHEVWVHLYEKFLKLFNRLGFSGLLAWTNFLEILKNLTQKLHNHTTHVPSFIHNIIIKLKESLENK